MGVDCVAGGISRASFFEPLTKAAAEPRVVKLRKSPLAKSVASPPKQSIRARNSTSHAGHHGLGITCKSSTWMLHERDSSELKSEVFIPFHTFKNMEISATTVHNGENHAITQSSY